MIITTSTALDKVTEGIVVLRRTIILAEENPHSEFGGHVTPSARRMGLCSQPMSTPVHRLTRDLDSEVSIEASTKYPRRPFLERVY